MAPFSKPSKVGANNLRATLGCHVIHLFPLLPVSLWWSMIIWSVFHFELAQQKHGRLILGSGVFAQIA